jgi:Icc protein
VPFYTTLGNHELWEAPERYLERYGRASFQFVFRGVVFTFVDSGDAGLDPIIEARLDDWLDAAADQVHVFLTHFPPIDPVGTRYGSFRSRRDAHRLLAKLAAADVDLTLYGHVHSFLSFDNAGIPAFISGGGGAMPERWDGIGRHFLVIDIAPTGRPTVGLRRVD